MIVKTKRGVRCVEADGREWAFVENPWGVSVYHGRGDVTLDVLSWRSARALAWFLMRRSIVAWFRGHAEAAKIAFALRFLSG